MAETVSKSSRRPDEGGKLLGFSHLALATLGVVMVGAYLFAINQTAVQGYSARSVEHDIALAKEENQKLKIEEAELRSLGRIESARERLHLVAVTPGTDTVSYLEAGGSLALR